MERYISQLKLDYDEVNARSYRLVGKSDLGEFTFERVFKYASRDGILFHPKILNDFNYRVNENIQIEKEVLELHPFELPGLLGKTLQTGGAYTPDRHEMKYFYAGTKAALEFSKENLNDLIVYFGDTAWNSFFAEIAWDKTFVLFRKSDRVLLIIMATAAD